MLPVTSEGSSVQSRFCVKALMHHKTLWVLNVLNLHVKIRKSQVRAGYAMQYNDIIVNATKGFQQHIAGANPSFALMPFESQTAFHRFKNCMIDTVLYG